MDDGPTAAPPAEDPPSSPLLVSGGRKPHRGAPGRLVAGVGSLLLVGLVAVVFVGRRANGDVRGPLDRLEARIRDLRRPDVLKSVRAACASTDCSCVAKAAGHGLDLDAAALALSLLDAGKKACPAAALAGLHAEALVRLTKDAEGEREAREALARSAADPYASYALALASFHAGRAETAALTKRAVELERGVPALVLEGLLAYRARDFEAAKRSFARAVDLDPKALDARYNLALTASQLNRYGEARSGFLAVTRLDPKNFDARYNLALLAHSAGATEEAQHHLKKLEASAPRDPRLNQLRTELGKAPPNGPAMSPTTPQAGPAASASSGRPLPTGP